MEILFSLEVNNPRAVKSCVQSAMEKHIYRGRKDYYKCTIKLLKRTMMNCKGAIQGEIQCDKCQSRIATLNKFIDHASSDHQVTINKDDMLYMHVSQNQIGGNNQIDYHEKCLKYKFKYVTAQNEISQL